MRSLAAVLLAAGALAWAARESRADGTLVVVLDRGAAARTESATWSERAVRVARAPEAGPAVLLLHTSRADGKPMTGEAKGADAAALAKEVAARTKGAFEAPSDVRHALAAAVARLPKEGPSTVVLVGPFGAGGGEAAAKAMAEWTEKAPQGAAVLPLGLSAEALEALREARGVVRSGLLVVGVGQPAAAASPWSPLREEPLSALVRVPLEAYSIGEGPGDARALDLAGSAEDRVAPAPHDTPDGAPGGTPSEASFAVSREAASGRKTSVSFRAADAVLLAPLPGDVEIAWDALLPDHVLLGEGGRTGPAPFRVEAAEARKVHSAGYVLRRTRVGAPPTLVATGEGGALPAGLTVDVAPEVFLSDEVAESQVTVRFSPRAPPPPRLEGALVLSSAEPPLTIRIPYRIDAAPPRVRARWTAADVRLPRASTDAPWRLAIEAGNGNAPARVDVVLSVDPESVRKGLVLRATEADGSAVEGPGDRPLSLRVGRSYDLSVSGPLGAPAAARVSVEFPGTEVAGPSEVALRPRAPRLVAAAQTGRYVLRDGTVAAVAPLRLSVDADGGDGEWRAALHRTAPTLETTGAGGAKWTLREAGPGSWEVAAGPGWSGARPDPFAGRTERSEARVLWPPGGEPLRLALEVEVPPRWGRWGWVLAGLAALALGLGAAAFLLQRPGRASGTLLYAVEGLDGAVGRLSLSDAPRRRMEVRSDERGRLSLEGEGTPVATIVAARVGLTLEAAGGGGRHLLVDGLTLELGRHRLRYVSGVAEEPPQGSFPPPADLIGPEYDLAGGTLRGDPAPSGPPERSEE